jgi:hypothetical protein
MFFCPQANTTDYRTIEMSDPLEEIYDLFGRKSLPDGRKSFYSAFVVFLRETFLFVESTRDLPPTHLSPEPALSFLSSSGRQQHLIFCSSHLFVRHTMADYNPPPPTISRSSLRSLCRGERLLKIRSIQAAEAIPILTISKMMSSCVISLVSRWTLMS